MLFDLYQQPSLSPAIKKEKTVLAIGFGTMGKIHVNKVLATRPNSSIFVVDINPERLQEAKQKGYIGYNNFQQAIETDNIFDTVIISTSTAFHCYYIKEIISAYTSKQLPLPALFVEKPAAAATTEAEQVRKILTDNNYTISQAFMAGYLLRGSPAVSRLITKIREADDEIININITWQKKREPIRPSAGVIQDETTHSLDLIRYILRVLQIAYNMDDITIISAERSRAIVDEAQQDAIYSSDDENRNPFAKIEYKLQCGSITINGVSSFLDSPQKRSIEFVCKKNIYTLMFDEKVNKIVQDLCGEEAFIADKLTLLWETFFYVQEGNKPPVHMASIDEVCDDVILTNRLEEKARQFLEFKKSSILHAFTSSKDNSKGSGKDTDKDKTEESQPKEDKQIKLSCAATLTIG